MTTLNIVFLSGAGGVGKTSVAAELASLCAGKIDFSMTQSTTRGSYAAMGVKDETESMQLSREKWTALQERIFKDYADNLVSSVKTSADKHDQLLIVDRSPWDHASYYFQQAPYLESAEVDNRLSACGDLLSSLLDYEDGPENVYVEAAIWTFCYPTAWQNDESKEAWKRHAPAAKNYMWSLALKQMIDNEATTLSRTVPHHSFKEYDSLSITERAYHILASVKLLNAVKLPEKS